MNIYVIIFMANIQIKIFMINRREYVIRIYG